ncbi:hypothetical protein AB0K60_19750 [Thermopolyspora sp. NPDC052614]|uniref:hypothetical protein n=1 Tax=Thermopolyspora sp. NPDC052614 TaxID=3155682 RepID=UPI003436B810
MPSLSPRARKLVGPIPPWVGVLGLVMLAAQTVTAVTLVTGGTAEAPRVSPTPPASHEPIRTATPEAAPTFTPSPEPTPTIEPTPVPDADRADPDKVVKVPRFPGTGSGVIGRVIDKRSRLSYAQLGRPWGRAKGPGDGPIYDGIYSRRQTFRTETYGEGSSWWADVDSHPLPKDLSVPSPGPALFDAAMAMLDNRQLHNFPSGTTGRDIASQPLALGGAKGWVIVRRMRLPSERSPRPRAKTELTAAIAVDTGRARPSVVLITIPDTHRRLWPDLNHVIESIRVLR